MTERRDPNTPSMCALCGHEAWHYLKPGTRINTRDEAYVCSREGCPCVKLANDGLIPPGLIRVDNEFWDYACNADKYDRSRVRYS